MYITQISVYLENDHGTLRTLTKTLADAGIDMLGMSIADTANFGCMPWREVFTDPQLQGLIEKALVNNIDMKKADFNIQKVEAALKIAKLAYIPAIAFAPQGTISSFDFGKASQTYTIPLCAF